MTNGKGPTADDEDDGIMDAGGGTFAHAVEADVVTVGAASPGEKPKPNGAGAANEAAKEDAAEDISTVLARLLTAVRDKLKETESDRARELMKQAIRAKFDGIAQDQIQRALIKKLGLTPTQMKMRWAQCAAEVKAEDFVPSTPEDLQAQAEADAKAQAEADAARQAEADALFAKCREIAKDPKLVFRMIEFVGQLGIVGEKQAILAVYLTASSRLNRRKALSLLRSGSAAGGKSHIIEIVLKLFPVGSVIRSSGSSPKVLPYYGGADDEDALAHRIVYIVEAASIADKPGVENPAATMWRTLISENRVDYQTVQLVEGSTPLTISILKNGPIAVLISSATPVEDQTNTRLLENAADESDAQTDRIIDSILNDDDIEAEDPRDVEPWQAFQEWLAHGGPYRVRIPYLKAVRLTYREHERRVPLRFRRDLSLFVTAIRTSAIIHRAQRQMDHKGRIIADIHDYYCAYSAFNTNVSELYGAKVPARVKPLVEAIERFVANEAAGVESLVPGPSGAAPVPIRALMKELGLSSWSLITERLGEAVTLEVIKVADLGRAYGRTETKHYRVLVPSASLGADAAISIFPNPEAVKQKIADLAAAPKA